MRYFIDEFGETFEINEGDHVKIISKEQMEYLKKEDNLIEINKGEPFIKIYPAVIDRLLKDIITLKKKKKKTVYNSIEKLVGKKILHKGTTGKEYQLFMNPFIFMKGTKINKTLYSMFRKSKWNNITNKNKRHENPKN